MGERHRGNSTILSSSTDIGGQDYHKVKYDLLGNTHWNKKDRYDVGLDGNKYDIKGFHIGELWKANAIKKDPGWLLDCCALVLSDQVDAKWPKEDDHYVFPFMIGEFERRNGPDLFTLNRFRYLIPERHAAPRRNRPR